MAKIKDLTDADVEHLAVLANIDLNKEEVEKIKSQLTKTLHYVENLHELDTSSVNPTNYSTSQKDVFFEDGKVCTRMLSQEEALQNAKETKNKLFIVKRIKGL